MHIPVNMNSHFKILLALLLVFIASLFMPIGEAVRVVLLAITFIYVVLNKQLRKSSTAKKPTLIFWLMAAFCIWLVLSHLLSDNSNDGIRFLEKRIPLLIFSLFIPLLATTANFKRRLLLGIAGIVTIACAAALIASLLQFRASGNSAFLYNDSLSVHLGQQSIYTSLFVNISIYILAWYYFFGQLPARLRTLAGLAIPFLIAISYLLASRNMMLMLYASTVLFLAYYIVQRRKYLEGLTLLLALLMGVFLVYKFFPKTLNRFRELTITEYNYQNNQGEAHYAGTLTAEQWNGANFRLAAWPCGWQLFKEHPILGTGLGDKRDELNRVYREKGFQFAIDTRKNIHNNYLDILYSTGIVGLLLFLSGYCLLPFISFWRQRNWLAVLIHGTLLLAMITEVYFDRSIGTLSFAFWTCLLLILPPDIKNPTDYPPDTSE